MIDPLSRVNDAIVLDTNVWISALINPQGAPARLLQAILAGRVQLILSEPVLAEVHDVVHRVRIRRRIQLDDPALDDFLDAVRDGAIIVAVTGAIRLCRDPKDDHVIETAIVGGARYIVSRDEDLTRDLDLVDVLRGCGVEAVTVAGFLELLEAPPC